jgi:hypothetical protein
VIFTHGVLLGLIGGVFLSLLGAWIFVSDMELPGFLVAGFGLFLIALAINSSVVDVGRNHGHVRALRDLKSEGFNVRWLSINESQARIAVGSMGCQQTFHLDTQSGRYVLEIPSDIGDAILYPQALRSLKQYCSR